MSIVSVCHDANAREISLVGELMLWPQKVWISVSAPGAQARSTETMDEDDVDCPGFRLGRIKNSQAKRV